MSIRMTTCPNSENWLHVSRTIRPVTQVALVAVNIASMTPSRPVLLEMGRVSSSVPTAMTSRKLMQMVCVALLPASQPLLGRRSVHSFFLVFPIATSRAATRRRGESFCASAQSSPAQKPLLIGYTFFLSGST